MNRLLVFVLMFVAFASKLMAQDDVDTRIPISQTVNDKVFALIISNENYKHEVKVPYALNDGDLFSVYCEKTFGIPKKNIHKVTDATLNDMKHELRWLKRVMKAYDGEARAIIYYSGHGMPDEKNLNAVFLPIDGYATDASSGMSTEQLYKDLGDMPSAGTIVFLDACFSGEKREGGMMVEARSVALKVKPQPVVGRVAVFSAAQGDETAFPYNEKEHGMFTYFLLEKFQESGGAVELGELADYVIKNVSRSSLVENGKPQTPSVDSPVPEWRSWQIVPTAATEYATRLTMSKTPTVAPAKKLQEPAPEATPIITVDTVSEGSVNMQIMDGISDGALKTTMEENVNVLMAAFNHAVATKRTSPKLSRDHLTSEAVKDIDKMWEGSAMVFPPVNIKSRCLKTAQGYQVRGIPVDVVEAEDNEKRQELTIDFLPNGKISGVSIAIEMHRYDQIMAEKSSDIDYARRQVIIDFVENFRTAYNRKDLPLLNSVYSDKALIITGKVVSEKPNSDIDRLTLSNNKVVYIKQSKQEYLSKLAGIFKTNKFINVKFEDIDVIQHPKYDDIYGVTLKQYWHTSRYSDEGYLFLMIDFREADKPLIQVRTWQPYKNDEGQVVTKKEDVYHLGSFRIVR